MTTLKTTVKQTMFDHNCCILLLMSINSRLIEQNRSPFPPVVSRSRFLMDGPLEKLRGGGGGGGEFSSRRFFFWLLNSLY